MQPFTHAINNCAMLLQAFPELEQASLERIFKGQVFMHAIEKLALWVTIIYGALILVVVAPMYLLSSQQAQPLLLQVASGAYCLTLLPAALAGIRWKKLSGAWMMLISVGAACALCMNEVARSRPTDSTLILILSLLWWIIVSIIPGICGLVLFAGHRWTQPTLEQ